MFIVYQAVTSETVAKICDVSISQISLGDELVVESPGHPLEYYGDGIDSCTLRVTSDSDDTTLQVAPPFYIHIITLSASL